MGTLWQGTVFGPLRNGGGTSVPLDLWSITVESADRFRGRAHPMTTRSSGCLKSMTHLKVLPAPYPDGGLP